MRATLYLPPSIALIEAALTGLVAANRVLIQTGVVPPSPLDTKVRYAREASGLEEWNIALVVMRKGTGDCEDLACWECAGIQLDEDPGAHATIIRTGPRTFHCVVQLSNGEIVDVCPELGMRPHHSLSVAGLPWLEVAGPRVRDHRSQGPKSATGLKQGGATWNPGATQAVERGRSQRDLQDAGKSNASNALVATPTDPTTPPTTPDPNSLTMPASAQNPSGMIPMPMMDDDSDDDLPDEDIEV